MQNIITTNPMNDVTAYTRDKYTVNIINMNGHFCAWYTEDCCEYTHASANTTVSSNCHEVLFELARIAKSDNYLFYEFEKMDLLQLIRDVFNLY